MIIIRDIWKSIQNIASGQNKYPGSWHLTENIVFDEIFYCDKLCFLKIFGGEMLDKKINWHTQIESNLNLDTEIEERTNLQNFIYS